MGEVKFMSLNQRGIHTTRSNQNLFFFLAQKNGHENKIQCALLGTKEDLPKIVFFRNRNETHLLQMRK